MNNSIIFISVIIIILIITYFLLKNISYKKQIKEHYHYYRISDDGNVGYSKDGQKWIPLDKMVKTIKPISKKGLFK